ncbi:MAG: hypothetical protein GC154_17895, partial [bacterium]|nr:hypothetical protein [bacterium]
MSQPIRMPDELRNKIGLVVNQFQCLQILKCWFQFGLFSFACLAAFTLALKAAHSAGVGNGWVIAGFVLIEIAAAAYFLGFRAHRSVSSEEIALFIEDRYPDLENRIISAVSFQQGKVEGASSWIVERFFEDASLKIRPISFVDLFDSDQFVKFVLVNGGLALASILLLLCFYPLWIPAAPVRPASVAMTPLSGLNVEPGDARVRIGDRQVIVCKTGDLGQPAVIQWRRPGEEWQSETMQPSQAEGVFHYTFSNVRETLQYQVSAGRLQSEVFTITAWLPPELESVDVTYHYPDYLHMDDKTMPNSGPISSVEGVEVVIGAHVNKQLAQAEMVMNDDARIAMAPSGDRVWRASLTLETNGRYHIELRDDDGNVSEFNPEFDIQVQPDNPPEITVKFPDRDYEVTNIEEIPFNLSVRDDFGLKDYGLRYEVAGREPVRLSLAGDSPLGLESSAERLLMLEDLDLQPGDLVTWTVYVEDYKPGRDEFQTMGDPYFLEIRPYKMDYREAMTNAGQQQQQQGAGQNQNQNDAQQKEIVIAIWNLRSQAARIEESEFNEKRGAIAEAQNQLLDKVREGESEGMGGGDSLLLKQLIDAMRGASESVGSAGFDDPNPPLSEALSSAQKAYQLMIRMKPDQAEVQQRLASAGGGGGGGGGQSQGERPEIDALELNQRRNFYEEQSQTGQRMQQANETLDRIKELAQRQKNINEEISKLISEMASGRDLEELKRRLERLQEEEQRNLERLDQAERSIASGDMRDPSTREALQRLQETRESMNQGLENLQREQLQEARSSGSQAVDSLDRMEEGLRQLSRQAVAQRMTDLQNRLNELRQRQDGIVDRLETIQAGQDKPGLGLDETSDDEKRDLIEQKDQLADDFVDMMNEAGELAERSSQSQELTSRKLGDWLRETSQQAIVEDMRQEERVPLVRMGVWDKAIEQENRVAQKMDAAADRLGEVAQSMVQNDLEGLRNALAELRRITQPGENGPIAMNPQPGEEGQQGQGQQGQGQQGQGQQGQGQQGQGQQGQGQQGQG